jgi:hypothetical protein
VADKVTAAAAITKIMADESIIQMLLRAIRKDLYNFHPKKVKIALRHIFLNRND